MLHNSSEKINYYDLYYQDLSCPYLNTDILDIYLSIILYEYLICLGQYFSNYI